MSLQANTKSAGTATLSAHILSDNGRFVAEFLPYGTAWMTGTIVGRNFDDDAGRRAYAAAVMATIGQVSDEQRRYSTCTDGRKRLRLDDGSAVPLREQLVGTDTMAAFVAAESLGRHFYGPELYAPVDVRIRKVVRHLLDHGYHPTAHVACGAAGGFLTVINRSTQFINDDEYVARLKRLSDSWYSDTLHYLIISSYQSRLTSGMYDGYHDGIVTDIVRELAGPTAVEHYDDDGRGVHGHREQAIVYLGPDMAGLAVDPNRLIETTGDQVFAVSSSRVDIIARLMSGDEDGGTDYLTARLAIDDFSCAGHGTLAAGMETLLVRRAAEVPPSETGQMSDTLQNL